MTEISLSMSVSNLHWDLMCFKKVFVQGFDKYAGNRLDDLIQDLLPCNYTFWNMSGWIVRLFLKDPEVEAIVWGILGQHKICFELVTWVWNFGTE